MKTIFGALSSAAILRTRRSSSLPVAVALLWAVCAQGDTVVIPTMHYAGSTNYRAFTIKPAVDAIWFSGSNVVYGSAMTVSPTNGASTAVWLYPGSYTVSWTGVSTATSFRVGGMSNVVYLVDVATAGVAASSTTGSATLSDLRGSTNLSTLKVAATNIVGLVAGASAAVRAGTNATVYDLNGTNVISAEVGAADVAAKLNRVGGTASNLTVQGEVFFTGTNLFGDHRVFADPESGDLSFLDSRGDSAVRIKEGFLYGMGFISDNPEVSNWWQVQDPDTFGVVAALDTNGVLHVNAGGVSNVPMAGVNGLVETSNRLAQAEEDIDGLQEDVAALQEGGGGGGGTATATNVWDIDLYRSATNAPVAVWTNSAPSNSVTTLTIQWSARTTNATAGGMFQVSILRSNGVDTITGTNTLGSGGVTAADLAASEASATNSAKSYTDAREVAATNSAKSFAEAYVLASTNTVFQQATNAANTRTTDATNGAVAMSTNLAKTYTDAQIAANTNAANATNFWGQLNVSNYNAGASASASTFLRGDGTWATPSGGTGSPDITAMRKTPNVFWDEFIGSVGANPSGVLGIKTALTGTGAAVNQTSPEPGSPGVIVLTTGTTTTGSAIAHNVVYYYPIVFSGGVWTNEWRVQIPTLSDGTETFTNRVGMCASGTAAETGDAIYFKVTSSSANWIGVTRLNSTQSEWDTGVTVQAGTWYKLRFVVNADATSVTFTVNDAGSVTANANIPDAGDDLCLHAAIVKTAGTTARTMLIDYVAVGFSLTSTR